MKSTIFLLHQFQLRNYQLECIETCLQKYKQGIRRQVVSLPVGSGKTFVFANLIKRLKSQHQKQNQSHREKTLVLAHRNELLHQAYHHISKVSPELKIEFDQNIQTPDEDADIIISSVQTLGRADQKRLSKYNTKDFKCIIIDEAHHAAADSYKRILDNFGAFENDSDLFIWGCSATVRRHDKKSLGDIFQEITFVKSFQEMICEGWLCNFKLHSVSTETDLDTIRSYDGDFIVSQLSNKVNTAYRNSLVAGTFLEMIQPNGYKSTLVFAADIQHVLDLVTAFQEVGVKAYPVHSGLTLSERKHILAEFREGRIPVVVNCGILTEGVDVPRIDSLLLARPTKSSILLQQMIGRGLRKFPEKENCLIVDFVDNIHERTSLATVPTLLGLSYRFDFGGLDALDIIQKTKHVDPEKLIDFDNIHHILEIHQEQFPEDDIEVLFKPMNAPMNPHTLSEDYHVLSAFTELSWVRCGHRHLVLALVDKESMVIEKLTSQIYQVHHRSPMTWISDKLENKEGKQRNRRLKSEDPQANDGNETQEQKQVFPFQKRQVAECSSFKEAIQEADAFIKNRFHGWKYNMLLKNAKWRSLPASSKQMKILSRIKSVQPQEYDQDLVENIGHHHEQSRISLQENENNNKVYIEPSSLTKGMAANLITRFMSGAISKSKRRQKLREKKMKILAHIHSMSSQSLN